MTVGKTHSGKTTFAHALEQRLNGSLVIDQDNHAAFINTYYKILQPKEGPNTLKHAISKLIVNFAKENTDFHLIISNSNRSIKSRANLLEEFFPKNQFFQILVHFDIPDDVLEARIAESTRKTDIFRGPSTSFKDVLARQNKETFEQGFIDPAKSEADHLFVVKDSEDGEKVIQGILHIANEIGGPPND